MSSGTYGEILQTELELTSVFISLNYQNTACEFNNIYISSYAFCDTMIRL